MTFDMNCLNIVNEMSFNKIIKYFLMHLFFQKIVTFHFLMIFAFYSNKMNRIFVFYFDYLQYAKTKFLALLIQNNKILG